MPTTEFEDNGGTDWTSLTGEQTFLETLANETGATLTEAGESVQGRPIWRMDLGTDTDGTFLVVGLVHGNEPAPREAILQWIRDLAESTDMAITTYLSTHRVVVMPTVNPDGFEAGPQRANANGIDLNRDHLALSQPETRAIHEVHGDCAAALVLDAHERFPDEDAADDNVQYRRSTLAALADTIHDRGDELITALQAELTAESITHGFYAAPGRVSTRETVALKHSLGVTIETNRQDSMSDRVDYNLVVLEESRDWHETNAAALVTMVADSKTYQSTTSDQYVLETGSTDFPWPQTTLPADLAGYRMQGSLPQLVADTYGITSSLQQVPLSQQARAAIPILLDEESDDQAVTTVRLTTLSQSASFPTVAEFADVVYGSHRMVAEAWVMSTFQVGNTPDGTLIDIISGSVTMDATAEVFATLELETDGMDERRRSRFPRRAGDLLAPYGTEVFVRRGVDIGSEIMWSPLGYFRLNDDEQAPASDSPIRLSGQDRMSGIIDARLVIPRQYGRSRTFAEVVSSLVTDVYPGAVILFDDDSGEDQIGRTLLVEEDRHAGLLDLAESLGKVIWWDGEGVLRIEDAPDPDDLVWHLKAGYHGVLVDVSRRVSREGMANAIVARGEGGDTLNPVQAVVVDDGPNSPTRWFPPDDETKLWFGQVPEFYSSPLLTTRPQAVKAGTSLLRRRVGLPYQVDWGSVVNPALRPRHAVRLTQKDGTRERHIADTLTIPLVAQSHMTGTTREQTNVRISEVNPSTLGGG